MNKAHQAKHEQQPAHYILLLTPAGHMLYTLPRLTK